MENLVKQVQTRFCSKKKRVGHIFAMVMIFPHFDVLVNFLFPILVPGMQLDDITM